MDDFLPYYKFAKTEAYKICKDKELADDIVQEVFYKIYKAKTELTGEKNIQGYLLFAIRNRYIDHYRYKKKWRTEDIEDYKHSFIDNEKSGLSDELKSAIQRLPKNFSLPFVLSEVYGYQHNEISAMIDKPEVTVRGIVFRAKNKLRELIQ